MLQINTPSGLRNSYKVGYIVNKWQKPGLGTRPTYPGAHEFYGYIMLPHLRCMLLELLPGWLSWKSNWPDFNKLLQQILETMNSKNKDGGGCFLSNIMVLLEVLSSLYTKVCLFCKISLINSIFLNKKRKKKCRQLTEKCERNCKNSKNVCLEVSS